MALDALRYNHLAPLGFKGLNNLEVKYRSYSTKLDTSKFELHNVLLYREKTEWHTAESSE